ncbi:MAG: elongation factor Ts [Candidatus Nealsonbacteria bacterium]|nr:elongation factor Ts [Candidatus Nealsonbacteria bacterium]
MPNIDQVKRLREETEAPVNECLKALNEARGDMEKAKEVLRKWGQTLAAKKVEREVKEGIVDVYLHPNKKVGVILELRCESDFVAKSDDFQKLAHELCLQIAAANPQFVSEENIPPETLEKERRIYLEQFSTSGKPEPVIKGIVEGKLKKYQAENCLLFQPWIKDENKTVRDLLTEYIAKLGENIVVRGFSRLSIR